MLPSFVRRTELFPGTMARMESDFGRLMERLFHGEEWAGEEGFGPPANIVETEKHVEATLELPGLKPEEIQVELVEGRLSVRGEKKEEKEEKGKTFHRVERRYGSFHRLLPLPAPVTEEGIQATYKDGVLTVLLPKTEVTTPRKIEVKS